MLQDDDLFTPTYFLGHTHLEANIQWAQTWYPCCPLIMKLKKPLPLQLYLCRILPFLCRIEDSIDRLEPETMYLMSFGVLPSAK